MESFEGSPTEGGTTAAGTMEGTATALLDAGVSGWLTDEDAVVGCVWAVTGR